MGRKKNQASTSTSENTPTNPTTQPMQTTFDPLRFKTIGGCERYERDLGDTLNPERGIDLTQCDDPEFDTFKIQVATQGWEKFIEHPEAANTQVVREFYANFADSTISNKVWVRGKQVRYDAEAINNFYQLHNEDGPHDVIPPNERVDKEIQCESISLPSAVFDPKIAKFDQMSTSVMTLEARIWIMFICAKLFPTKSGRDITIDRLWAVYCITNGMKINVGKVINKRIQDAATQNKAHLFYPHLIWQLCKRAGVTPKQGDLICETKTVINRYHIDKYCRNKPSNTISRRQKKRAQVASPPPEQETEHPQPEQPPRWAVDMVRFFIDTSNYNRNLTIYHGRTDLPPFPPPTYPTWEFAQNMNYTPGAYAEMPNFENPSGYVPEPYVDPGVMPQFTTGESNDEHMFDLGEGFDQNQYNVGGTSGANNEDDEEDDA